MTGGCVVCLAALLFLFYPAILAALKPPPEPFRRQVLHQGNDHNPNHTLSIVIPAYNEEDRLPHMLKAALQSLQRTEHPAMKLLDCTAIEWILVSDGSTDATEACYQTLVSDWSKTVSSTTAVPRMTWRLLALPRNAGKGAAVRTGMLHATGHWRLFCDADGATDFGVGLERVAQAAMAHGSGRRRPVVLASRGSDELEPQRSALRSMLMRGFQSLCRMVVGVPQVVDTQCGFKLFPSETAAIVFRNLHLRRWAFDVELVIMLAELERLQESSHATMIHQVPVPWHEVEGSKLHTSMVTLVTVAITMLRDMVCVRLCYSLGLWRLHVGASRSTGRTTKRRKED